MPVIKSAKKKLRQDKIRTTRNAKAEDALKVALKAARKSPSVKSIAKATSLVDKAAKNHIIHKNKAARIKSKLSLLVRGKEVKEEAKPKAAKVTKKTVAKKTLVRPSQSKPAKKK